MGVRVKMEVNDAVSAELRKLGAKSPEVLTRVLAGVSLAAKKRVQGSMRRVLTERTGKTLKGVQYRKTSKVRFRLQGPKLGSIYEYNGADIFPKNAKVLKWRDKAGNWQSSNYVHIDARPFFYPSMRDFVASGEFDRAMEERLEAELAKERIDL